MKTSNDITLKAYENNLKDYINKTPQKINGEFKLWIDQSLDGFKKSAEIIEIGVAFGRTADYIEAKGFKVERTDAVKVFINFQQKAGHEASLFNILKDNFKHSYDMILAEAVMLHFNLSEMKKVTKKAFVALKPGGKFVFSVKQGSDEFWEDAKLGAKRYFHFWQPKQIEEVLLKAKFNDFTIKKIVDTRKQGKPDWLLVSAQKGDITMKVEIK